MQFWPPYLIKRLNLKNTYQHRCHQAKWTKPCTNRTSVMSTSTRRLKAQGQKWRYIMIWKMCEVKNIFSILQKYQLSISKHQLSIISHQLSIINHEKVLNYNPNSPSNVAQDSLMSSSKLLLLINLILYLKMTFHWELVILDAIPSMLAKFRCMLEGSVKVWANNNLYWFIEGLTHFGMPGRAEISWPLFTRNRFLFNYNHRVPPSMHHKWQLILDIICKTNTGKW